MIAITKENISDFGKRFWKDAEMDVVTYEGVAIPFVSARNAFLKADKEDLPLLLDGIGQLAEKGVILSAQNVKKAVKMLKEDRDDFARKFSLCGGCDLAPSGTIFTEDMLRDIFMQAPRFHGRTPGLLPQMAAVSDRYGIDPSVIFEKFNIRNYQKLQEIGLPKAEVVLVATELSSQSLTKITSMEDRVKSHDILSMISNLLSKGYEKRKNYYKEAAEFVATHTASDINLLRKVAEDPEKYGAGKNTTVDEINAKEFYICAKKEVEKIEKAYKKPGFKLKNCKCKLKDEPVEHGKYKARILAGDDPIQVELGYATDCCQHLGDAGETSMMYGLTNERAGFWVVENKTTGKIYAQAESWEADEDTLVFDNIEFANDAEISQYKEIIAEYLLASPYKNIIMGRGYNSLAYCSDGFEHAPDVTPNVTPYDVYVMSYEEDADVFGGKDPEEVLCIKSEEKAKDLLDSGKVTYYDYLYSDVDDNKGTVYLKKDGRIAGYFDVPEKDQLKSKYRPSISAQKNIFSHIDKEGILGTYFKIFISEEKEVASQKDMRKEPEEDNSLDM